MKNKILSGFVFQLVWMLGLAQSTSLSGVILDESDNTPLIGTHVVLINGQFQYSAVTDPEGSFLFEGITTGSYQLQASYVGYEDISRDVHVTMHPLHLGTIKMKQGIDLDEVQVVEQVVPVMQKGDTTQFNAAAFKTLPDADAIDLIEKMPTVVIDNGTVQAQGEDVKKVLVDGRPFFGNDPQAALQNIPAEIIDKIEIFDQQSDQAQFTGFDDGETTKTINIVTRPNMRNGEFGKIYGGYGVEDKYQAGGNINFFNGDQRISIIGLSNNINQQNFSTEDLLGVVGTTSGRRGGPRGGGGPPGGGGGGPGRGSQGASTQDFLVSQQGGITSTNAFGLNFSDQWGKKLSVSASYFFNQSDNHTIQDVTQQYFDEEGLQELYAEESNTSSININHRFSGLLEYKINENNSLIWRPSLSWQGNDGQETVLGQTSLYENLLNQSESDFSADLSALNLSSSLLWRHRFEKRGRTLSVNLRNGYAPKEGDSYLLSSSLFDTESSLLDQYSTLDNKQWSASANVHYTEPLTSRSRLMLDYRASYQEENRDKYTYDFAEATQEYDDFNESLSNVFSNDYFSQALGGGYNFNMGDWRLMARANYQWAELLTDQTLPYSATTENTFQNVLPMVNLMYRPSRSHNFHLMYRASTDLPSIDQLQNVIDNSNPLQLSIGNPQLLQAYQHHIRSRFTHTNSEKSSVFFAMFSANFTNNYIGTSTYLSAADYDPLLEESAQISVPVNLDGYRNVKMFTTYGFPLSVIKSNLNIDLTGTYTRSPGLINEEINYASNTSTGLGLTLASNISDRIDFTVSSRSHYNFANNSLQSVSSTNYFNQKSKLRLDWILGNNFVFRSDITHDFYSGLVESFDQNYLLWNMSIGKKVFKDQRGEISLTIFDLLNQNNALTRNVTEIYTEDIQTNVLQQYFMLSFKYDIRHFKKKVE